MIYRLIKQDDTWMDTLSVSILNEIISLYAIIWQNARAFHWNVKWPHFSEYHEFFWEIYNYLSERIDDLAERIKALDGAPFCKYSQYLEATSLIKKQFNIDIIEREFSKDMMTALMEDFEVLSYTLWEKIKLIEKDNVSQDLLIQEKYEIDKFLWKLRAFSEEK